MDGLFRSCPSAFQGELPKKMYYSDEVIEEIAQDD